MRHRRLALPLTAALAALALPTSAGAADVEGNSQWLAYKADAGEINQLAVSQTGGTITFDDPGATIDTSQAGGLCGPPSGGHVTCTLDARELKIELGDGDDALTTSASSFLKADGQDGADTLTGGAPGEKLSGGAGNDTISGGGGDDQLYGGPDSDELTGGDGVDEIYGEAGADRVLARDGNVEQLSCGDDADWAEIDPLDVLAGDCESGTDGSRTWPAPAPGESGGSSTDAPPPPPQIGRTVTVEPARGVVTVRLPDGDKALLGAGDDIPVGSVVDTTRGTVALTSAADANGNTQTAEFSGGVFQVRQRNGNALTDLVLKGKLDCSGAGTDRRRVGAARGRFTRRRLWGSGNGRFRTRGRHSSATVRGTIWLTEDRCDGTYTRVKRGVVAVKDFGTGKTKLVRAGRSYLAKRR